MYASLLIPLVAAFTAVLVKQWLNRYMLAVGESMVERCGNRQRKCDGFESQQFRLVVEALPVMLQASPILLAAGISQHMWSINTSIASVPIALSTLALVAYGWFVILGGISPVSPYQTPLSVYLHHLRSGIGPVVAHTKRELSRAYRGTQQGHHRQPPPTPLDDILVRQPEPWLRPGDLTALRGANADDARCASWILWNFTSPEVFDTVIQFVPMVLWFKHKLDVEPPYDLIVSTLQACFDSTGELYPWLRDRAYYSMQSVLWIHICAACISAEFVLKYPLPNLHCSTKSLDTDLAHLLEICASQNTDEILTQMYRVVPGFTHAHSQWTSNALLHLSWARRHVQGVFRSVVGDWSVIPLDAALNHLLTWCISFDWPVDEEVLRIQDKS